MKKLFISMLISAICVISISATASPVIYEKQKSQVSDVSCKSKIVIQEFKFSQEAVSIVSRAKYNEVSIPIYKVMIVPSIFRYEKKKFVCFNKKINKQRAQLYGLTDNKEQYKLVEMDDYPIDKEVSIILDIWQLVASNVKDQA